MSILMRQIKGKSWVGVWYLTLLVVLPAFIGIPTVLWLATHSAKSKF